MKTILVTMNNRQLVCDSEDLLIVEHSVDTVEVDGPNPSFVYREPGDHKVTLYFKPGCKPWWENI